MAAKKQVKTVKKKKKHWYPILASKEFRNVEIGECLLDDPNLLKGRKIAANLMTLTREPKKQNTKIKFVVDSVEDNKGITSICGYETLPTHIKRISKKSKTKIEDSFLFKTKDNKTVRFKIMATSKNLASRQVKTSIRLKSREVINDMGKKTNYNDFVRSILNYGTQTEIKKNVKKILPVKNILVKAFSIVKTK